MASVAATLKSSTELKLMVLSTWKEDSQPYPYQKVPAALTAAMVSSETLSEELERNASVQLHQRTVSHQMNLRKKRTVMKTSVTLMIL